MPPPMLALSITWLLLGLVSAVWIYIDGSEHVEYPVIWAALALTGWPLILPLYIYFRVYTSRKISRRRARELDHEREHSIELRFPSEIEKAKYIEAALSGPGTLFQPLLGDETTAPGFPHFSVARADILLAEGRHDEAWEYLTELYAVALQDLDARGMDTYRHYLLRLPNGQQRLSRWLEEQQRPADAPAPKPRRDVPF